MQIRGAGPVVVAVVVGLALAACGTSSTDDARVSSSATVATKKAPSTPSSGPPSSTNTSHTSARRSPAERAKAAALLASDLPDHAWVPEEDADTENSAGQSQRPECDSKAGPFLTQHPAGQTTTAFSTEQAAGIERLTSIVMVFSSDGAAAAAMQHARELAMSCGTWANGGLDGKAFRATEQLVERGIGDDGFLIRGQLVAVGMDDVPPAYYMWVMTRRGDADVLVHAVWPGGLDRGVNGPSELEHYAVTLGARAQ